MNWTSWLVWGFAATVILSSIVAGAVAGGVTRMNIPYLLGTAFTPDRDRATLIGTLIHFVNGWIFSVAYVAAFHLWGGATWWRGALIALVHAGFVLTAGMQIIPAFHPRMASEHRGALAPRQLEPPGFLGLHYGVQTPVTILVAHLAYGVVLGAFYQDASGSISG